jgi:hypothetical protein
MSGPGFGLGNPDKVFDKTGNNASGHVLDTPTFYALSVVSMLAGFLPPAGVAFLTRGWDIEHTSLWWYIAALVGVIVCMTAAAAYAIRCQNWALSLIAYLGFVAAPFGVLFGPFVHATGAQYLVHHRCHHDDRLPHRPGPPEGPLLQLVRRRYPDRSDRVPHRIGRLIKISAHNHTVLVWVAIVGIVIFFFSTINDANRMKSIAHMDTDNAVDVGMQLWLNAINILIRVILVKRN